MIVASMITADARLWKAKEECSLIRGTKLTDYEHTDCSLNLNLRIYCHCQFPSAASVFVPVGALS